MCSIVDVQMNPGPTAPKEQRTLEALEHDICELAAHLAAATCSWLLLVAEFDARQGWAEWGVKSCAHWLSWRCGIGLDAAREHVRVGRRLGCLPLVRAEFASGVLSYSKVRATTRVASEQTEADLVELARHATGAQLEKLARKYGQTLRATSERAQAAAERQQLNSYWDEDGMLVLQGRLSPEDGAAFLAALAQAEASVPEGTAELGAAAVRAQALVALATGGGQTTEIVVHVDADTLAAEEIRARSELTDGPAMAPETVRRLACDGAIVRIIERDGHPLSVGRRTRSIPPAIRRALGSRDGGCRFPGCTHTRHLHAHHIRHWARGGSTAIGNLVQLCSYHHQLVHEGGYGVECSGDGRVRFRRPDGRQISESCEGRAASGSGIRAQNRSGGLRVDANTCFPLSAGDPIDYGMAIEGLILRELDGEADVKGRSRADARSWSDMRAP
jgi:hypothetical protein